MRSTTLHDEREDFVALGRRRTRRAVDPEDNSQAAVLQELGLTLAGFLLVFVAVQLLAVALGAR